MKDDRKEYYPFGDEELKALKKAVYYTKKLNYDKSLCDNKNNTILDKQKVA